MRIVGIYSFNQGKEIITRQHSPQLEEVLQIIESVNAASCKIKVSKGKTRPDRAIYNPTAFVEAFTTAFASRGWKNHDVIATYSQDYYVPGYKTRVRQEQPLHREMDFIKDQLGVEVQFGKDSFGICNVCANMTIFAKRGVIDCGIEIIPVEGLADEMLTEVSCFEQSVWDLEHRGISDIDIPILILGIDTNTTEQNS